MLKTKILNLQNMNSMLTRAVFALVLLTISMSSCQQESGEKKDVELQNIEEAYFTRPSHEAYNLLIHKYFDRLDKYGGNKDKVKPILLNGLKASELQRIYEDVVVFLSGLITDYPEDVETPERIIKLATYYEKMHKIAGASVLYAAVMRKYPKTDAYQKAWERIPPDFIGLEAYMDTIRNTIYDKGTGKLDASSASAYIDGCEALVMALPEHPNAVNYLLDGGKYCRAMKYYDKAVWFYDWILEEYPESDLVPLALLEQGITFQKDKKEFFKSRTVLLRYLNDFPDGDSLMVVKQHLMEMGWEE